MLHEAEMKEHLLQRWCKTQEEQRNEIEMLEETLSELEENLEIIATQKEKFTAQKMKFSIKDFFSTCDQIRSFLRIWSHLLKKP